MGKHKGKKNGWKNEKKKWEDEACCSAVNKLSLDEGNSCYSDLKSDKLSQSNSCKYVK